jgi:hypothetical protein
MKERTNSARLACVEYRMVVSGDKSNAKSTIGHLWLSIDSFDQCVPALPLAHTKCAHPLAYDGGDRAGILFALGAVILAGPQSQRFEVIPRRRATKLVVASKSCAAPVIRAPRLSSPVAFFFSIMNPE